MISCSILVVAPLRQTREGGDKVQGSVGPRFPAGLPFQVPETLEFVASGNSGKLVQLFPDPFQEFSSGTPQVVPGRRQQKQFTTQYFLTSVQE